VEVVQLNRDRSSCQAALAVLGSAGMRHTHQMGERRRKRSAALIRAGQIDETPQAIDMLGGRVQVRWDGEAAATPHG
jgi:hypothetical protein